MSWTTVFEYAIGGIISTIFLWFIPNLWNKFKHEIALKEKLYQRLTPKEISKIIKNFDRKYDEEDVMAQIKKGVDCGEFAHSKTSIGDREVSVKEFLTPYADLMSPMERMDDYEYVWDYFEEITLESKDVWKWFENFRHGKYNDKTQIHLFKHQANSLERSIFGVIISIRRLFKAR